MGEKDFDSSKVKFYVDGVEVGGTENIGAVADFPEYETIKLPNLTDISLSGVWYGGIDLASGNDMTAIGRQNGKTGFVWDDYAAKIGDFFRVLDKLDKAKAISKKIRRSSYRKTKSQRRRGGQ